MNMTAAGKDSTVAQLDMSVAITVHEHVYYLGPWTLRVALRERRAVWIEDLPAQAFQGLGFRVYSWSL